MAENVGEIFYTVDADTGNLVRAGARADKSLDQLQAGMAETDKSAKQLGGGLNKLAQALAGLAIGRQIAVEFSKAVAVTREFNKSVSNLSAITGATGKDLEFLRQTALEFGRTTTLSASQAAEALKLVASAKPDLLESGEALKAVTREAVTLAEAAGITLPQAAGALTTTLNQFQLGAEESARVINVLAAGAKEGSSEIAQTVEVLKNAGVVAAQSGLSIEEFNGAVQALAKGAIAGAEAGTGLRNILTILNTQTDSKLRPSVVGLTQALANLEATGLDDVQMVKLFGRENITAAKVLLQFRGEADRVTKAITGTSEAYRQASANTNNLDGDTKALASAYEALQIQIGSVADDSLRSLTQALTEVVSALAENKEAIVATFDAAGFAAQAFGAVIAGKVLTALIGYGAAVVAATRANLTAIPAVVGFSSAVGASVPKLTAAAVALNATALAARTLQRAMLFLGGPAGVVILAAVALAEFAGKAETSEQRAAELDTKVQSLTESFRDLSRTELDAKLASFAVEAAELEGQIDRLKAKQTEANTAFAETSGILGGSASSISKYAGATQELAEQDTEGLDLSQRLEANRKAADAARAAIERLNTTTATPGATAPSITGTPSTDGAGGKAKRDPIKDQIEDLQIQADTLGFTSSELEIYKLQLAGATDEQIRAAQSSLALIDAFKMQADAEAELNRRREQFGTDVAGKITGQTDPLTGGAFDEQTARYEAEAEAENVRYAEQLERLRTAKELQLEVVGGYQALEEQLAQQHADRLAQIETAKNSTLLQSGQQLFDGLAGAASAYAGEQSGIYKALFAASKAFALADAAVKIQQGIAGAAALPFPANLPAIASVIAATSGILSTISSTGIKGGRQYGGPTQAGSAYRVNENGQPELFQAANGQQYMIPNTRGEVVSNADATGSGGAGVTVTVNLIENAQRAGQVEQQRTGDQEQINVFVADIRGGGPRSRTLEQTYGLQRQGI